MKQYEQFGTCLKRILEEEQLSASQTAKLMKLRSRNSIFRILTEQTSVKVQEDFLRMLKDAFEGKWPQQHWMDLEQALEIARLGIDGYLGRKAFRYLIDPSEYVPEMELRIPRPHSGYTVTELRPELEKLFADGQFTISICGCCTLPLCSLLADVLRKAGEEDRVFMRHYVSMVERSVVRNIVAIQPLLYFRWYEPLLVDPETCTEAMLGVYSAGTIFIEKQDDHGEMSYTKFIMYDRDKVYRVSTDGRGISETIRLLNSFGDDLPRLCTEFPARSTVDDYVAFTEHYRKLEYDNEIFSLKPDVALCCISTDIMVAAVRDGFRMTGFVDNDKLEDYVQRFAEIQKARYENIMKKRKVTQIVLNIDAMTQFMRTGVKEDHFFGLRPFTLAERLSILNHICDESANNPYFFVRFLKPEYTHPSMKMTMYGNAGVVFTQRDSAYQLSKNHSEAMVNHPAFEKKCRDFFIHDLLPNYTLSHKESLVMMTKLAQDAAKFG